MKTTAWAVILLGIALAQGRSELPEQQIAGGGSSFVFPMMSKWSAEYKRIKGVDVSYRSIGSKAGIQQMTSEDLDFACTDLPLDAEQLRRAREAGGDLIYIPLVLAAVVPAYHVDGVKGPLVFSGPVLADIYLGKIRRWNHPALQGLNPGVALPDCEITVLHHSDPNGKTFIFSEYLATVSPEWKKQVGVGPAVHWPVGLGQKG